MCFYKIVYVSSYTNDISLTLLYVKGLIIPGICHSDDDFAAA